jgi:hypothetical protein
MDRNSGTTAVVNSSPIQQFGAGESVTSLCWLRNQRQVITGMNIKWLRLFDLRNSSSSGSSISISTRAVFGMVSDPFKDVQVASYSEDGIIKVWDLRRPSESLLAIPCPEKNGGAVLHIAYSPTRSGVLGALYRDCPGFNLFEVVDQPSHSVSLDLSSGTAPLGSPDIVNMPEPMFTSSAIGLNDPGDAPDKHPCVFRARSFGKSSVVSFDFIQCPSSNIPHVVMLTKAMLPSNTTPLSNVSSAPVAGSFNSMAPSHFAMSDVQLQVEQCFDPAQISWSPKGQLAIATENSLGFEVLKSDISYLMGKRVVSGYGMNLDINQSIVCNSIPLKNLWTWIQRMEQLCASGRMQSNGMDYSFRGIQQILQETEGTLFARFLKLGDDEISVANVWQLIVLKTKATEPFKFQKALRRGTLALSENFHC